MNAFFLTLIGAIVIRVFLDLSSLDRSSYLISVLYVVLFAVMGAIMVFQDTTDVFGYLSIVVAIGWAWFGYYKFNSRKA